jgi:hypothetical protein
MSRCGVLLIAIAVLVSCTTRPGAAETTITRDFAAAFQSDSLSYTMERAAPDYFSRAISITYRNRSARPVDVEANCHGATDYTLMRWSTDRWTPVFSPPIEGCLSGEELRVAPAGVWRTQIRLSATSARRDSGSAWLVRPGTDVYRVVWRGFSSPSVSPVRDRDTLTSGERTSNRFRLTVP